MSLIQADARRIPLVDGCVQCVVTSPPYWGLRDYGTARWEGGEAGCDHLRPVRQHKDGCLGCGCPMQDKTPGCRWCDDRHVKRRINNTPNGRSYEKESELHWKKPRSRDQVTEAGIPYTGTCGKCGAVKVDAQIGLEASPEAYTAGLVAVFREVWRVLADDGVLWLNLGDSYAGGKTDRDDNDINRRNGNSTPAQMAARKLKDNPKGRPRSVPDGLKPKDLVGIPWRTAFALQADGWYLRSDIIWSKPNPMPESVTDRPTKAHEYVFLLTKQERYYYDADAIREPHVRLWDQSNGGSLAGGDRLTRAGRNDGGRDALPEPNPLGANCRSVWRVPTMPYPGAHFATMPEKLAERCILAGSRPGDLILDPFGGSGTTVRVARRFNRRGVMLDLNPAYLQLAEQRISGVQTDLFEVPA